MKKVLSFVAITTVAVVAAFNLNINTQNGTNNLLTLVNAEALAEGGEAYALRPCCEMIPGFCEYDVDGVQWTEYGVFYYD
ncbi:MAG: hypothetical protein PHP34_02135 [Bacteroidales bacterium]|nr:hypothetical protein [Bacteroidales bacterium]